MMSSSLRAAAAGLSRRVLTRRTTIHSSIHRHAATLTKITAASSSQAEDIPTQNNKKLMALACLAAGTIALSSSPYNNKTDCCGIAGVVGTPNHDARYVYYHVLSFSRYSNTHIHPNA